MLRSSSQTTNLRRGLRLGRRHPHATPAARRRAHCFFERADDLGPCLQFEGESLCTGCVTGTYATVWGNRLIRRARQKLAAGQAGRTYE